MSCWNSVVTGRGEKAGTDIAYMLLSVASVGLLAEGYRLEGLEAQRMAEIVLFGEDLST